MVTSYPFVFMYLVKTFVFMYFVQWFSHKIRDNTKYSLPITTLSPHWNYAFLKRKLPNYWNGTKILKDIDHVSKTGVTISGIQRFFKKKFYHHLWGNLFGRNYVWNATKLQNWWQFKIINPIHGDSNFGEDSLKIHPKSCKDESYISE